MDLKNEDIINKITTGKALDLGCGLGQYTKYLLNKEFDVILADISIEVLNKLKENIARAKTIQLDASCRVLEKAGFELEGILRSNAIKNNKILDMKMYSIIKK